MTIPRRPHFILRWHKAGQLDPETEFVDPVCHWERGIYVVMAVEEDRTWVQYLGMTFNQSFAQRIGQHLAGVSRFGAVFKGERYLYVAAIEPKRYKQLSKKMVAEIEDFLIWALHPPGNRVQLRPYRGREMLIENAGSEFGLPRYLFVRPQGLVVFTAQGSILDDMSPKVFRIEPPRPL